MKTRFIQVTAMVTSLCFLSSCANIQNDGTRTRTEGALTGAAIGGIAGAIIGNQSNRAWEGAAIGAAIGGLGGLAVGDHVAKKKAGYASQEAWLDACISRAEQVNADAVAYNRSLSSKIRSLESRLAAAKASGNKAELRRVKQSIVTLQSDTRDQIEVIDTEIVEQREVVSETGSSTLNSRVSTLRSTRSSLSTNEERLADLGNQIDV
jgi:uncharacterized membrane protein YebE (DUF533 family)